MESNRIMLFIITEYQQRFPQGTVTDALDCAALLLDTIQHQHHHQTRTPTAGTSSSNEARPSPSEALTAGGGGRSWEDKIRAALDAAAAALAASTCDGSAAALERGGVGLSVARTLSTLYQATPPPPACEDCAAPSCCDSPPTATAPKRGASSSVTDGTPSVLSSSTSVEPPAAASVADAKDTKPSSSSSLRAQVKEVEDVGGGEAGGAVKVCSLTREAEQLALTAEQLCRAAYEEMYMRAVKEQREEEEDEDEDDMHSNNNNNNNDNNNNDQGSSGAEDVPHAARPVPLCSIVIEVPSCVSTRYYVVGCDWLQWDYLQSGPLAYYDRYLRSSSSSSSGTHDDSAQTSDPPSSSSHHRRNGHERHCLVRLLHPTREFMEGRLQQCSLGMGGDGDNEGGLPPFLSEGEDLVTNVEYDLSEPRTVPRSLLGVAMAVWADYDPHLVARVTDLEATEAAETYNGVHFWGRKNWTSLSEAPPTKRQLVMKAHGHGHGRLPVPLLPGEYVDAGGSASDEVLL